MEPNRREGGSVSSASSDEILREILGREDGLQALIQRLEDDGYTVRLLRRAYRTPLLKTLLEMGGSGEVRDVLSRVERKIADSLREWDYTVVCSNGRMRWEDNAHWMRNQLREEGVIAGGAPFGIWELTQKGIEEAENLSF